MKWPLSLCICPQTNDILYKHILICPKNKRFIDKSYLPWQLLIVTNAAVLNQEIPPEIFRTFTKKTFLTSCTSILRDDQQGASGSQESSVKFELAVFFRFLWSTACLSFVFLTNLELSAVNSFTLLLERCPTIWCIKTFFKHLTSVVPPASHLHVHTFRDTALSENLERLFIAEKLHSTARLLSLR